MNQQLDFNYLCMIVGRMYIEKAMEADRIAAQAAELQQKLNTLEKKDESGATDK